jgi:hypothetical protein
MIDAAECRDRAKDCANRARTEASQKLRSVYSGLARSWATLAAQIERQIALRDARAVVDEVEGA